jgi:hypothetical protein
MDKISKIMWVIFILLSSILFILISKFIAGENVKIDHTLTKAICLGNSCQDYNISCKNQNIISMTPTGDVAKFSPDWKDPRTSQEISNLC